MIVQERGKRRPRNVSGGNSLDHEESGEESESLIAAVEVEDSIRSKRSNGRFTSCNGAFCSYLTHSLPKVVIVALIFLSVVILIFVRNRSETGALLCIEAVGKESGGIPFPVESFKRIRSRRDDGVYSSRKAEKWMVVSVSRAPTPEIQAFAKVPGWQVVAIGNSRTPTNWRVQGVIFLSIEDQMDLGYRINSFLPFNSFVRKNVGYIFAIQHGAKKIYDADETASLLQNDLSKVFDVELTGAGSSRQPLLQYRWVENRKVVNPFIHFGQRSVWPRGLPLESVSNIFPDITYAQVARGNQFIQQSLANGLPDVDSIFYLTRKAQKVPLDIQFDSHAPPVALPQGTLAPINSLNTLFHSPAFWSLLLPVSVSPTVADIIRGYMGQRLLWEVGGTLAFYPPLINRVDKFETTVFAHEKDFHADAEKIISFLLNWRSNRTSLFQKILHLSHSLAEEGFLTSRDVQFTLAWLKDLVSVGYKQPRLLALELDRAKRSSSGLETQHFLPHTFPAVYLGVEDSSGMGSQMAEFIRWRHFFGNIVLILECAGANNHTVLGWRMFYGRLFKHVVILSAEKDEELEIEAVTWQTYKVLPGIFDRYPNADGFLFLTDDVVLNYWNLEGANKTKLWTLYKVNTSWNRVDFNDTSSAWFHKPSTKRGVKKAIRFLPSKYRATYSVTMDENHFVAGGSEIYYVPQGYVKDYITLVTPVDKAQLRSEVAIPMILMAMDKPENYEPIALSNSLFLEDTRKKIDLSTLYSIDLHAIHPWRAASESEMTRLFKTLGTGDPLLLDVFD